MDKMKYPLAITLYMSSASLLYGFVFIFSNRYSLPTSEGILGEFIRAGNMKIVGLSMIIVSVLFEFFLFRKKMLDEYQTIQIQKKLIANGIISIFILPVAIIIGLMYQSVFIEVLFCAMVLQWLLCILKNIVSFYFIIFREGGK